MADLGVGAPTENNGRAQNGGSRATTGQMPVPQNPSERVRTPTDIMRERRDREARKKAASEKREQEVAAQRRAQADQPAAAGDAPADTRPRERAYRTSGAAQAVRTSAGDVLREDDGNRRRSARNSTGATASIPPPSQQQAYAQPTGTSVDKLSGVAQSQEPTQTSSVPQPSTSRRRTQSQGQTAAVPTQPSAPRIVSNPNPQPRVRQPSTAAATAQTQVKPSAASSTVRPQNVPNPGSGSQQRSTTTSSFPHAFERWETLSSHWEGLTSFWIRRLQQNSDEIDKNPLNSQLARQVNDLSAAGANLFHAVVELQRLRASSERKFQRWFFETKAETEKAQEVRAGLEKALDDERAAAADATARLGRVETDKNSAYQTRTTAEQMVKEMRRELQISKDEARRAWEELGRREQEERDRTLSLKNGQPTLVGGVQVVPMLQGAPSGQASTNRPSTREGPYQPGPSARSGPESLESPIPGDPGYTTFDPARSDTDTDPFTEGGRVRTGQSIPPLPNTIPQPQPTSNASAAALQAAQSAARQAALGSNAPGAGVQAGGTYLRYGPAATAAVAGQQQQNPSSAFYQHEGSSLLQQPRTTEADERSYVPSVPESTSQEGDEEYEINPDGEYQRDEHGRLIPFRSHAAIADEDLGSEDTDEYDVQDQLDRERMYGQRYGGGASGIAGVEYGSGSTTAGAGAQQQGQGQGQQQQSDYSGSGFAAAPGWEAVPRHHHPTRLSDVLEEDERTNRTSPSRASQR
ncbi:MAG: hypothetical protein Q9220_001952 [cf. Caloplaca sp. 1 TL-2023]